MLKKILIIAGLLIVIIGGVVGYFALTNRPQVTDNSTQALKSDGFSFDKDWRLNYDKDRKQLLASGTITNKNNDSRSVVVRVDVIDDASGNTVLSFVDTVPKLSANGRTSFTFAHDYSAAITGAHASFTVVESFSD